MYVCVHNLGFQWENWTRSYSSQGKTDIESKDAILEQKKRIFATVVIYPKSSIPFKSYWHTYANKRLSIELLENGGM
jgi:hypothetical protein